VTARTAQSSRSGGAVADSSVDAAAEVARALAHPARIRTLAVLRDGELCVCHLTSILGLAPSTVSSHLRELRQAGLIEQRRTGRWIHVRLADAGPAREWLERLFAALGSDGTVRRDARRAASMRANAVEECPSGPATAPRNARR
jgi:arsenate reductase/ArsR family transcriptional regulator